MKQYLISIGAFCLLLTGCSKGPDKIVAEVYDNAKTQQYGKIANLILPDSIEPLNEEELGRFEELMKTAMKYAEYADVTVDSVTMNPEGSEAKFVVSTKFKDGKSYTERGTLRKTASDRWRLLADKEASDTTEVYSVTNKDKHTTELMRNLNYTMANILSTRGLPQYQVIAADYLDDGIMTKADKKQAFELYENAADKEYVTAYRRLGWAYFKGSGVKKDLEKSFEWYLKAAEAGDTKAYRMAGDFYRDGEGTMKDYDKAIEWYTKAMEANDPNGYWCMGLFYENGQGVEKDLAKFHELLLKAYEIASNQKDYDTENLGNLESNLGRDFEYGKGVDKDINKAIEWYKKSAERGSVYGMTHYADVYYNGKDGTPKDYDKAFYWYGKAAATKNVYGRIMLAECYEYGRGTAMNKSKAKDIYWELYSKENNNYAYNAWKRVNNY